MSFADPKGNVFKIDENRQEETEERLVKVYTLYGSHDFLDEGFPCLHNEDEFKSFAKFVQNGDSKRFFIKVDKHGRLFNPSGLGAQMRMRRNRQRAKDNWRWRPQTEKVFGLYLDFLKSKNPAHLHNAERERV